MKKALKTIRPSVLIHALGFLTLSLNSPVFAQSNVISKEAQLNAIAVSTDIKTYDLFTESITSIDPLALRELSPEMRLRHLRQYTYGRLSMSNKINSRELLEAYSQAVEVAGDTSDRRVYELHKLFLNEVNLKTPTKHSKKLRTALNEAIKSEDWFLACNAWILKSTQSLYLQNPNVSLQEVQQAVGLIPNEISTHVMDAKIITLSLSTTLNNLLLNPELAIENTAELIQLKQKVGYPVDGSSLLNNLLYSLSRWREDEVSSHLAQAVLEIEKEVGSNTPGLTELRVAQLYDRQGKFDDALTYSRAGLKIVEIETIRESLKFLEANALAGLNLADESRDIIVELQKNASEKSNNSFKRQLAHAELNISIAEKDYAKIHEKLNLLLDLTAQHHLRAYSTNTANTLASLENTKERQAEREAALKREAVLKQAELDQQKQRNRLLVIIASLLSLGMIAAFIFARFRDKVSKQLAIKTREAEDADRMKSEFLGMVSHELRTPLNGIVGIADLLSMKAPTADMRHKAGIILDSSNKLTHVIESIVDMSRIDGEKMELYPEATDVHDIVMDLDQLWRPTIENKGVIFTSFVDNSLADEIILDKTRLRQCLNNLLSNAAKFTDEGRVHLHVTAKAVKDTGDMEVTAIVADTGQGISQEVQDRLFTPFLQADSSMTRKHGGSGLGLAITQSLARMMDGDVVMVSKQGRGSEFTLTVRGERSEATQLLDDIEAMMDAAPLEAINVEDPQMTEVPENNEIKLHPEFYQAELTPAPARSHVDIDIIADEALVPSAEIKAVRDPESLRGLKALIVDDVAANQDVIKLFLDPEGCECHGALSGNETLKMLGTQNFDIILMDIRMPEMDGIEATRAIRQSDHAYKDTPIIALTADASAETNAACMAAGADIFLTKPVMARELIEAIKFVRRFQDYENDSAINAA